MAERMFNKVLEEIFTEKGIAWASYSYGWVYDLHRDGRHARLLGYHFGLNDDASSLICQDKSAASDILAGHGIPHVHHSFFYSPTSPEYMPAAGEWESLTALLRQHGALVCKDNVGTGGKSVVVVRNQRELEAAVYAIFATGSNLCVCPYVQVQEEYRVILLEDQPRIVYKKVRPSVTGDGVSSVRELYLGALGNEGAALPLPSSDLVDTVPADGEVVPLEWRHNLGQGAHASLDVDDAVRPSVCALAISAAKALGMRFASVDVIQTDAGLQVLEVNSGVMMDAFLAQGDECYELGKSVYADAVDVLFA